MGNDIRLWPTLKRPLWHKFNAYKRSLEEFLWLFDLMQTASETDMTSIEPSTATCNDGKNVEEAATGETKCVEDISLFAIWASENDTNSSVGEWDFVPSATSAPSNTPNAPSLIGDVTVENGALEGADGIEGLNMLRMPTVLQPPSIGDLHSILNQETVDLDSDTDSDCDSAYETAGEELDDEPQGYSSSLFSDGVGPELCKQLDLLLLFLDKSAAQLSEGDEKRFWKSMSGIYCAIEEVKKEHSPQVESYMSSTSS